MIDREAFDKRWARYAAFPMVLQHPDELFALCKAVAGAKSFLEIGTALGGSLWCVCGFLAPGATVVSVDLRGPKREREFAAVIDDLTKDGFSVHLVDGDSTARGTVEAVRKLGPFEWVFIDGGHSYEVSSQDWRNYGFNAVKGCAFHDVDGAQNGTPLLGCGQTFMAAAAGKRHDIIVKEPGKRMGMGIIWK